MCTNFNFTSVSTYYRFFSTSSHRLHTFSVTFNWNLLQRGHIFSLVSDISISLASELEVSIRTDCACRTSHSTESLWYSPSTGWIFYEKCRNTFRFAKFDQLYAMRDDFLCTCNEEAVVLLTHAVTLNRQFLNAVHFCDTPCFNWWAAAIASSNSEFCHHCGTTTGVLKNGSLSANKIVVFMNHMPKDAAKLFLP